MSNTKELKENVNRRGKKFRKRMKNKGFVYLCHWVPLKFKEKIKDFAKFLRDNDLCKY